MKKLIVLIVVILSVSLIGAAFAVPKGKSVSIETKMGLVVFSGDVHANAEVACKDCHSGLFEMKKGTIAFVAPHKTGQSCGSCHNGERAFSVRRDCKVCHKK
jgi:c(7)-type cytochrome triheme protein